MQTHKKDCKQCRKFAGTVVSIARTRWVAVRGRLMRIFVSWTEVEMLQRDYAHYEASDLGSGFQIAMKDLKLRSRRYLGGESNGVIMLLCRAFIRMLNKAVEI